MEFCDFNNPQYMEEKFKDILEKDEKIVKMYKPNKCKFWVRYTLFSLFGWLWAFFALVGSIPDEAKRIIQIYFGCFSLLQVRFL